MEAAASVPSWLTLLIQVPLVGVFVWYSLEMAKRSSEAQKAFMDALDKRDAAFEARNTAVITAINSMNNSICAQLREIERVHEEHDKYVRENLNRATNRSRAKV